MDFKLNQCPSCKSLNTWWHHGLNFEHQRKCSDCGKVYAPDYELERYKDAEKERLLMNTSKE
jgi:transposase-like protein